MKKLFSSLPFRLILGIAVGILCGLMFPESVMKVIVTLQYIMGHANVTMTLGYYAHASFESAKAKMERSEAEKAAPASMAA